MKVRFNLRNISGPKKALEILKVLERSQYTFLLSYFGDNVDQTSLVVVVESSIDRDTLICKIRKVELNVIVSTELLSEGKADEYKACTGDNEVA